MPQFAHYRGTTNTGGSKGVMYLLFVFIVVIFAAIFIYNNDGKNDYTSSNLNNANKNTYER